MRYKKYTSLLLLFSCLWMHRNVLAQEAKQTFTYQIKDKDTLRLDIYSKNQYDTLQPCIVYVFGGGFVAGKRDDKLSVPFFEEMTKRGFTVISIDYRLGFRKAFGDPKDKAKFSENLKKYKPLQFLDIFYGSINMAVEDLFDATSFVIKNAKEWHIDTSKIITLGSSAGAITVLQGENYIANQTDLAKKHLPTSFNYAGVMSMAGAIFSMKGDVKWNSQPSPILFFHGNADQQVPYDEARIKVLFFKLKYGFYGSKHLSQQLEKIKSPYWFYSIANAGHEMSYKPMLQNINEMTTFYHEYIERKKTLSQNTNIKDYSLPEKKKNFGFADYVKGNFGGK